ncbi:MAG: FecR family protein, partial [Bacteroidaceae bacterium]
MNKTSNNIWNIAKQLCTFVQQKEREFPDAESQTRVWQAIQTEIIRKKRRRRVFLYSSIAVASSVLLLLIFPNIIWKSQEKDPLLSYVEQLKQRKATFNGQKEIILELGKNNIVTVQSDDSIMHSSNGDVYVNQRTMNQANELTSKTENSEEIYNQLSVPLGKRIKLRLSDGTNLWVNSGTRVVYPITFKQRRREIFVDGEVYLDVAHDTERPFLVRT